MAYEPIGATNNRFIGLSSDTKPTDVKAGATFLEYDTGILSVTPDNGTTWIVKSAPGMLTSKTTINLKQAAANYDLFELGSAAIEVISLVAIGTANLAAEATFTGFSIQSTDDPPVAMLDVAKAAMTAAGIHFQYAGPAVVAAGKKIQLTIKGGATAANQNMLVFIAYRAGGVMT